MSRWPGIRRIFRLDRGDVQRGVDDELRFHFEMKVTELGRQGLAPPAARSEAERLFGDVRATRQHLATIDRNREWSNRMTEAWNNWTQDVHHAFRGLWHTPGFTLAVVAILGLGIGINATMFGIIDRLLFRAPAYLHEPNAVHRVYFMRNANGVQPATENTSYPQYEDMARFTSSFTDVIAHSTLPLVVGAGDAMQKLPVSGVSAGYWRLFDTRPALGRFFTAEEDRTPAGTNVAVLGYDYWQSHLGGRADVVGLPLQIGDRLYTVIGVAPKGFDGLSLTPLAAIVPITAFATNVFGNGTHYATNYGWQTFAVLVHRRPGVSPSTADADLANAYRRSYAEQRAANPQLPDVAAAHLQAMAASILHERGPNRGPDAKVALWLAGVALFVLIIACSNIGGLLLARAIRRRRETAVRLALGISRRRLLMQIFTEGAMLACLAAVVSIGLVRWGSGIISAKLLPDLATAHSFADPRTLAVILVISLAAGMLASFAPAVQTTRSQIMDTLRGQHDGGRRHPSRLRSALLVVQAALSVVLLVGAGSFVRSLHNVSSLRLGYDAHRVLYLQTESGGVDISAAARESLLDRLVVRVRELPGIEGAARGAGVPFMGGYMSELQVPGVDSIDRFGMFALQAVSPGYFETMGTRILRGRAITSLDQKGNPRSIVVSQTMASTLWPGRDPLGQCVKVGDATAPCSAVVGVAENILRKSLKRDPGLQYYLSLDQWDAGAGTGNGGIFVRTDQQSPAQIESIRRALQPLMPGSSYITVRPLSTFIDPQLRSWQLGATMFTLFGCLALLVAAVGLYTVVAYDVEQRRYELGLRVALGARTGSLVQLVVGAALSRMVLAVAIGIAISLAGARWLQPLLFGTSAANPAILAAVTTIMLAVTCTASIVPAVRATRIDPNAVLRSH